MEGEVKGGDALLAILAYFPVLFLIPLVLRRRSRFLDFHAWQGLYLFSVFLALLVPLLVLGYLFLEVWTSAPFFLQNVVAVLLVLWLAAYALLVLLMAGSVLQKRMVMLPILGDLAGER